YPGAVPGVQRQLRRWRHHHRREEPAADGPRPAGHAEPVRGRAAGALHLLGGHPTRTRGPRHVRDERGDLRARPSALRLTVLTVVHTASPDPERRGGRGFSDGYRSALVVSL